MVPILSLSEAIELERTLLGKSLERVGEAMYRAGTLLGQGILADFREVDRTRRPQNIVVLLGKGHNAGDALVALHVLLEANPSAEATLVLTAPRETFNPLTYTAYYSCKNQGARVKVLDLSLFEKPEVALENAFSGQAFDVCIDGLFGMSFRPPFSPLCEILIHFFNTFPAIRLRAAVDLPSGLSEAADGVPFRADFTYATGSVKRPLLSHPNVGHVRYLDLGFFQAGDFASHPKLLTLQCLKPLFALRPSHCDKRDFGHLAIIAGSLNMPGALMMATKAALRSGVGRVTVACADVLVPSLANAIPEAMWLPLQAKEGCIQASTKNLQAIQSLLSRTTALLIGPGMGQEASTRSLMKKVLAQSTLPAVLDADALFPELLVRDNLVLTPHEGEYKRLEGYVDDLATFAKESRAVVVLKGPLTQISNGVQTYYSPFGGPILARGGSGDVLAGLLAGFLAQNKNDAIIDVAAQAVVLHGYTADCLARSQNASFATTTDLLDALRGLSL
ncbi:MAG: NAD(P)H-hydrate dehydratase [Verrucomicrobia bacterium GWF2_51_19]|nr:MAG: NAD(P)H-hydrate dehydratase [Verrucomicrobia bacterium GWF2_51_19]HCJ11483.1 NAD(P)H-hydrate dehydratase [Opitutae bacterium]